MKQKYSDQHNIFPSLLFMKNKLSTCRSPVTGEGEELKKVNDFTV